MTLTATPPNPRTPLDAFAKAMLVTLLAVVFWALVTCFGVGCTKPQARTAIHAADTACETVALTLADGTATAVCLAWDALSPLLREIVAARSVGAHSLDVDLHGLDGSVRTLRISDLRAAEGEVMGAQAKFGARRP